MHFHVFSLTTKQENFLIRRVYKQKLLIYLLDALEIYSSQKIIPLIKRLSTRNTYKRQVTQHGCLPVPSLLGDGDHGIEKYTVREKSILYWADQSMQPRLNKNLLYRHDKPNEPIKKGLLSFVLFESPFTSVSTVSKATPIWSRYCLQINWSFVNSNR